MNILFIRRCVAYLIDILLLFIILAPAAVLGEKLLGLTPQTHRQVWFAVVFSFSIPAWFYFILSDQSNSGATFGKRFLHLRVALINGDRLSFLRSFSRTAIKLLPWEMVHIFGFALADQLGNTWQSAGLITANILILIYLGIAFATKGQRSLHDLVVGSQVFIK